jgi:hypothetical protein
VFPCRLRYFHTPTSDRCGYVEAKLHVLTIARLRRAISFTPRPLYRKRRVQSLDKRLEGTTDTFLSFCDRGLAILSGTFLYVLLSLKDSSFYHVMCLCTHKNSVYSFSPEAK